MRQTAQAEAREDTRLARTDPLTGIANRRQLADSLDAELERARRTGQAVGVVLIARRLKTCTRRYDLVGRYGGEEFLAILPGIDSPETLLRLADELRAVIARRLPTRPPRPPESRLCSAPCRASRSRIAASRCSFCFPARGILPWTYSAPWGDAGREIR